MIEHVGIDPLNFILDEIERVDYDVFNHRAYVAKVNKLLDLPRSFLLAQSR